MFHAEAVQSLRPRAVGISSRLTGYTPRESSPSLGVLASDRCLEINSRLTALSLFSPGVVAYCVFTWIIIVLVGIIVGALLLVAITYVTWLYRQGSFPVSRLRRDAKRAAHRARQLDREDNERKPEGNS